MRARTVAASLNQTAGLGLCLMRASIIADVLAERMEI